MMLCQIGKRFHQIQTDLFGSLDLEDLNRKSVVYRKYSSAFDTRHQLMLNIMKKESRLFSTKYEDQIAHTILKLISNEIIRKTQRVNPDSVDKSFIFYTDPANCISWDEWFRILYEFV